MTNEARIPPTLDRRYDLLIDGERQQAADGRTFRIRDPYSMQEWGEIPWCSAADVDRAVLAARAAFDSGRWSEAAPAVRGDALRRLAELIVENTDELALVQSLENGKILAETRGGIEWLARQAQYFAALAEMVQGDTIDTGIPGMFSYTLKQPVGVVAAITPWNSPLGLLGFKLFPALAAGCTVVIKPSEFTPASTILLAELCATAGIPDGVVSVVTGFGDVGAALVEHPGVNRIAFTGSTETGKRIAASAAGRLARVTLELGGKSPNIVFADAELDKAARGALAGVFAASGQTCVAGSRILVQRSAYEDFLVELQAGARAVRLGDPLDAASQMGPIANAPQFERILGFFDDGRADGIRTIAGGRRADASPELERGFFVEPTIYADVDPLSRIAQEEIFGPVASVLPFDDEEDALRLAHQTRFGLASGVWTSNMGTAHRMIRRLRAGTVWVNNYRTAHHSMPFAGHRESGVGRELGRDAVEEFTELKSVWLSYGGGA